MCACEEDYKKEGKTCYCHEKITKKAKRIVFQFEVGKIDMMGHIHFYVDFGSKEKTEKEVKKFFKDNFELTIAPPGFIVKKKEDDNLEEVLEGTLGKNNDNAGIVLDYVKKKGTCILGGFFDTDSRVSIKKYKDEYTDQQKSILDILAKQKNKEILMVYDPGGDMGKSYIVEKETLLSKYGMPGARCYSVSVMVVKSKIATMQILCSKIVQAIERGNDFRYEPLTIFLDIPRTTEVKPKELAELVEEIRKGIYEDGRYMTKSVYIENLYVCVFTNNRIPGLTWKYSKVVSYEKEMELLKNGEMGGRKLKEVPSLLTGIRVKVLIIPKESKKGRQKSTTPDCKVLKEGLFKDIPNNKYIVF